MSWINADIDLPIPYVTVLIMTEEWLYPVAAFIFPSNVNKAENWMLSGKHEEDYDNMIFFKEKVICWMEIPE